MPEAGSIDTQKLRIILYSQTDDFSGLDFTQKDGQDPLGVNSYIHDNPQQYINNHLSAIYTVKYDGNIVAYFTLSMSSIGKKEMVEDDRMEVEFHNYPAILLGQLGVDKKFRGRKLGEIICSFCRGIGQQINTKSACAFLILFTTVELAMNYYDPKCHFKWKQKKEGKVWMYRRLF